MQFQELIQTSLTKHVNTALKYFLHPKDTTDLTFGCLESFLNFLAQFTELN